MIEQNSRPTIHADLAAVQSRLAEVEQQLAIYQSIIEQLTLGLHLYHLEDTNDDRTLRIVAANPAVEQLTGVSPANIIGKTLDENFPDLRAQGVPQAYAQVIRSGEPLALEVVYGDERIIENAFAVRAVPLPGNHLAVTFDNITQRKQAELEVQLLNAALKQQVTTQTAALRRSQELLHSLTTNLPIVLYVLDAAGVFTLSEGKGLASLGMSPGQAVGLSAIDLYQDSPTIVANLQRSLAGEACNYLAQVGNVNFDTWTIPRFHEDGTVSEVIGFALDITERTRMEAALRISDESLRTMAEQARLANLRFERIFEATPLASIEFGLDGHISRWNASAERIFGWRSDEVLGQEILSLVVPPSAMIHVAAIRDALFRGEFANSQNANVTKDGRTITCRWYNTVIRDAHGQVTGVLSQTEDITDQVQREEELRLFKLIVERANDGIGFTDATGSISYSNPAHRALLGYGDDIIGLPVAATVAPESLALLQQGMQEVMTHGSWRGESVNQCKDGSTVPVEVSIFTVQDTSGALQAIVGFSRDITDRKRAEEEHATLQQQIIAAQEASLRELSTPLLPLADGVLAMPLIGTIDRARAQQIMETLLPGITTHQARVAILDITGVEIVDTQVADALLRAAQAVKLLGAQVILTGIRPPVAQMLVQLGVDLRGIVTRATLQAGITYAFRI